MTGTWSAAKKAAAGFLLFTGRWKIGVFNKITTVTQGRMCNAKGDNPAFLRFHHRTFFLVTTYLCSLMSKYRHFVFGRLWCNWDATFGVRVLTCRDADACTRMQWAYLQQGCVVLGRKELKRRKGQSLQTGVCEWRMFLPLDRRGDGPTPTSVSEQLAAEMSVWKKALRFISFILTELNWTFTP